MSQDGGISDIEAEIDQIDVETASPMSMINKPTTHPNTTNLDTSPTDLPSLSHKRPLEVKDDLSPPPTAAPAAATIAVSAATAPPVQIKNKKPRFQAPVTASADAAATQANPNPSAVTTTNTAAPATKQQSLVRPAFKATTNKKKNESEDGTKDAAAGGSNNNNKENATTTAPTKRKPARTIFIQEQRPNLKKEHPTKSAKEIEKMLSDAWKQLSKDDKKQYDTKAAADKQRYQDECRKAGISMDATASKEKKKGSNKGKEEHGEEDKATATINTTTTAKQLSAFELFSLDHKPKIREDHPDAGDVEVDTLISAAWNDLSGQAKGVYITKAKDLLAENKKKKKNGKGKGKGTDVSSDEEEEEEEEQCGDASGTEHRHHEKTRRGAGRTAAATSGDENTANDEEEEELESDITAAEWEAHPADFIISESSDRKKYLVARKGLALSEAVIVDASKAKLARLQPITSSSGTGTGSGCGRGGGDTKDDENGNSSNNNNNNSNDDRSPVSLDLISEHEASTRQFWQAVADCKDSSSELDLEQVGHGHPLELCALLGMLRYDGFDLDKPQKGDFTMKVPLLGTCRVVQRLVDVYRKEIEEWKERAVRAEAALQQQ